MERDTNQHNCHSGCGCSRRSFLIASSSIAFALSQSAQIVGAFESGDENRISPAGPASKYTPTIKVTFVRRKEEYGMWWPGAVYDGEAALRNYRSQIEKVSKELGVKITMRPEPIYSPEEADRWVAQAKQEKPDGLLVVLLDRQQHSWPTAYKAIDTGIPTVVFAPVGAAFTTNTWSIADKKGIFICSTDDFNQVAYGMKMLKANAKLREMRLIVLKGKERRDSQLEHLGTKLRYVPAKDFLDEYNRTPITGELKRIAAEYMKQATKIVGASKQDVLNGVKSFTVARTILEREEGDAITMDCLGALGQTKVSLPCIAWSRMLDHGIPAACEADLGASVTHALVQLLFDRPGFQQDPVPETARGCLIGAHCTCATRLNGFDRPPEPYRLSHHHGNRDAVPIPVWKIGQRVTVADIILSNKDEVVPKMIISAGKVVENISVPPSGGCVVSVMLELDGVKDLLGYPGFHQIFFYGDYKKELQDYCRLFNIEPEVI